ncbi:MAG: TIR domain-containing protein [Scytonema hyalinum WJT4-NPBG1]|jgi:tetratricopeptide (TPR) repeat protein/energy-coupling factor transporter ATP-binding protein EcfA2|nr:TIR domain-containing protein [Scytonema hyalinum WJT4-NPBG1]
MNKEYDLFISYADADRPWVEGYLLDALTQAGVRHLSETAFRLGSPRIQEFQRAVQQSQRTLLVLSPAYLADSFNQFVDLLGQTYGEETQTWPVIPLVLQPVQLPPRLAMLVQLRAVTAEEQTTAITRLCADLKLTVPTSSAKPPCPYPGMEPFTEAMSDRFFGREEEIEELLGRLRLHPFLMVIGPSGSGKSSLVFAGLLPKLRQVGFFGAGEWLVRSMRPGATPLTTLKEILGNDPITARNITQILSTQPNAQRFLLVIDQFEEVFTQVSQETVPFQQALLELTEITNVYLVLTVRADFYSDLMTSLLWRKIQAHRLEVVPLDEVGLRQAILKPAEDVGVFIEPALLERLVADARGEPGVLPLLQETLVLLWEHLERRLLPLRAYEALILPRKAYGIGGSEHRTGLQVAIARRADDALATLEVEPDKQRAIARRIFLRLVQFGEGRADTRRQQPMNALQAVGDDFNLFDQTLHHLANRRLLTLSSEETSTAIKVDIAHEALISGWPSLQQWILERREAEQTRRRLTAKAEEWVRLGEGAGGLLDKIELDEAERWLSSQDAIDLGYDASLPRLITASQRMIRQAKAKQLLRFGFFMATLSTVLGVLFILVFPWSAIFLNNHGFEKFSKGQDETALQDFNLALMLNPTLADALYNRGLIYQERQDFDLARANYQAAVEHRYAPAYGNLARLEIIREQNYTKAAALATEGLQLTTDDEARYTLLKNLGWAQLKLKKYPQAEVNLKHAITLDPQRGSAYCLLAQVLEFDGPKPAVREQWNNCLKFGSSDHPDERGWIEKAKSKLSKEGS